MDKARQQGEREHEARGHGTRKRGKLRSLVATLAVVLALGAAGYGGWRALASGKAEDAQEAQKPPQKVPVVTEAVAEADYPVHLNSLGTVEALNNVTVRAQVSGQIRRVAFKEGQIVKQDDLLVEIDPRPLQAALEQARAKLAQDRSSLSDAQVILERFSKLAQQQIATRQQLDTQAAAVSQLTSLVAGDQAAVDNAETQLGYATVRAPIAGRVGFRLVDVGNLVSPSDTGGIVSIQQVTPIAVIFTAPESDLGAIRTALEAGKPPVDALSSDGETSLAKGTLRLVDNTVDAASGTVRLKATFANDDSALWPGMSVTTSLLVRTEANAAVISEKAVQHGPDGLFAYVVGGDGKAAMRKITVGNSENGRALVSEGLKPGEEVVVEGQYRVQPGTLLDPRRAEDEGKDEGKGSAPPADPQKVAQE